MTATCHECSPPARFIGVGDRSADDNLARHTEVKHAPRAKSVKPEDSAAAVQRVVDEITDRIADGTLQPGAQVKQSDLVSALGTSRHYTDQAVKQLVKVGALRWTEAATSVTSRRSVVNHGNCWPEELKLRRKKLTGHYGEFATLNFPR